MGLRTNFLRAMGLQRIQAEEPRPQRLRMYEGARVSRLTSDWVANATSADAEVQGSNKRLRNRARQLVRDNDYARQAVRAVKNNVIGTGIKLQAQVKMQRGGRLDEITNAAIEKAWAKWGKKETCNTAGRYSWTDIERMVVGAMCESGEVFVRLVRQPFGGSRVPFALEIIEADLLDDEYTGRSTVDGNQWRMGVECDKWGRPIQYAFLSKHPGDIPFATGVVTPGRHRLVPASEIIHLYLADRPGQTRGVTWFASAIKNLHQLAGFQDAEVVRARASSALMGFITSDEGELLGDEIYDRERVSNFEPGVFKYLAPGESVTVPDLNAPDGQFEPFMRAMLRSMAAGLGCAYTTISSDYSQSNYSSSRLSLIEERDHWRSLQQYLIENFHQPIYEAWLEMAVLGGELNLPVYEADPDRYRAVRWMPRGWSFIDPQKEVLAYKDAVRCGFKTLGEVVAEQGGDLDELLVNRQREMQLIEELDLYFDTDPSIEHEVAETPEQEATEEQPEAEPIQAADNVEDNLDQPDDGSDA